MKKLLALCAAVAALVMIVGCPPAPTGTNTGSGPKKTEPTKPEPTKPDTNKVIPPVTKATITIEPVTGTELKQGEEKAVTIKVKRGDYKDEIALAITIDDKSKVTAKEKEVKIAKDKSEAMVTLAAAADAPEAAEVKVEVKATGKDLEDAKATIPVKVNKK